MDDFVFCDLFINGPKSFVADKFAISEIPGLSYYPNFVSLKEEIELLNLINKQEWSNELRRRVQHYGWKYDYRVKSLNKDMSLGPMPKWIKNLAIRLWEIGITEKVPDQVIINEYRPGQGISNHVDCEPCFGKTVISLSLGSACKMTFINIKSTVKHEIILSQRSLLCMKDQARYQWSHGIIPRLADDIGGVRTNRSTRVSITFRNVLI